ncbi:conjugal transfer protein [Nocardia sp. NPDC006044]|uniref:conjugal transfer protein n=1 Tax=Nocardia sp. NPDC006044 TaxID=3364306 RepID=UPI003674743B
MGTAEELEICPNSTISRVKVITGDRDDSSEALLRRMAARRRRDNIVIAVLAVLAVLGGMNAIAGFFSADPPPPSDDPIARTFGHAQLAGSFAEQFVVSYVSGGAGQQDRLDDYVSGAAAVQPSGAGVARQVSDPMVVYVSRGVSSPAAEVWSVTVSVRAGRSGTAGADQRNFYRVAVSVAGGRLRALSLPALVEAPRRGVDLRSAYSTPCGSDSPLAQVASGFLGALLTGSGDVARYVAPESGITALQPSPFTGVDSVSVMADAADCGAKSSSARVLATITPKGESGAVPALAYPLTMVRTAGQWQVRSMDAVPALSNPLAEVGKQDSHTSASTSATAAPTTTAQIPPATQK